MITNLNEKLSQYDDKTRIVLRYFNDITNLSRPSGGEKGIFLHLFEWAKSNNFDVSSDAAGNIAIDVPALSGCEDRPRIILQGHMDMVAKGGNNFGPTIAEIDEENWVHTGEKTTLGADNGLGIAMAMATAEDPDIQHGPMTLYFTVDEERGLTGVREMDTDILPREKEVILINLDSEEGADHICRGCAGGIDVTGEFFTRNKIELGDDYKYFKITLDKLPGGHSGCDIHLKRGNAIDLLNEIVKKIDSDAYVLRFEGGEKRNVIPSEAWMVFATKKVPEAEIEREISDITDEITKHGFEEIGLSAENARNFIVNIRPMPDLKEKHAISQISNGIFNAVRDICALEIEATAGEYQGGVKLSNNLGVMRDFGDRIVIATNVRAADSKKMDQRVIDIRKILEKHGADNIKEDNRYEGWLEDVNEKAIVEAGDAVREALGREPIVFAYHAGLECAYIRDKLNNSPNHGCVSAVAMGPLIKDAHSVRERFSIDSLTDCYKVLMRAIERY